eukprot:scaffold33741_cov63-Phaeocystis_antarctica.AAC.8
MASAPISNKESVSSLASRIDLKGVTCLVRSDLNTPFVKGDGPVAISDDTRIKESLPTLRLLTDAGAKVVVCSHVGRPKGQRVEKLSTAPIAARLSELLGKAVASVDECNGDAVAAAVARLAPGELLLLENLRFHAAEQQGQSAPLAGPQLGSCASSGRTWRLWAAWCSQEEAGPLSAPPVPRVLELAASNAADSTAFDHSGGGEERPRLRPVHRRGVWRRGLRQRRLWRGAPRARLHRRRGGTRQARGGGATNAKGARLPLTLTLALTASNPNPGPDCL